MSSGYAAFVITIDPDHMEKVAPGMEAFMENLHSRVQELDDITHCFAQNALNLDSLDDTDELMKPLLKEWTALREKVKTETDLRVEIVYNDGESGDEFDGYVLSFNFGEIYIKRPEAEALELQAGVDIRHDFYVQYD